MATGICRAVLAWYSPRLGAHATSLGHSSARAVPSSSSASTMNVWAPTSAVADQCRALTHAAGQSSGGGPGDRIDAEADFRSVSHLGDSFRQILAVEENDVAVGLARTTVAASSRRMTSTVRCPRCRASCTRHRPKRLPALSHGVSNSAG